MQARNINFFDYMNLLHLVAVHEIVTNEWDML